MNTRTLESSEKIIQVLMTSIEPIFSIRKIDLLQSNIYTQIFLTSSKCLFLGIIVIIPNVILKAKLT